jgi:hypothetical protein
MVGQALLPANNLEKGRQECLSPLAPRQRRPVPGASSRTLNEGPQNRYPPMKLHVILSLGLTLGVSLLLPAHADAQILWRWFGPKTPDKTPAAKAPLPDPRRVTEVNVEIAWLADPATFPYYLEARATANQLEVRGYVPNRSVREHAIKIAQVYSSTPVLDSVKEHPSLLVRPGLMPAQQLQNSAQSSLKVALPKQYQQLKVDVGVDGKVSVVGPVNSYEEKIAVSHALRRLHGCTSVQNLTALPAELMQASSNFPPPERTPIVKTSSSPEQPKSWLRPFGNGPATTDEPPLYETAKPVTATAKKTNPLDTPVEVPAPTKEPEVVKVEVPAAAPKKAPALSAAELQRRVKAVFPGATNVTVELQSATEVRITLEIGDEKDLGPAADRIFAMPELQDASVDLQFKIGAP